MKKQAQIIKKEYITKTDLPGCPKDTIIVVEIKGTKKSKYYKAVSKSLLAKSVIVRQGNGPFLAMNEKILNLYIKYYFVNSKGEIHEALVGKDKRADTFRKSIGNYHENKDKANTYIKKFTSEFYNEKGFS